MKPTNIVILTGAGVSAESGIKTFRDNDGLWESHRIEDVATPRAWEANAQMVWRFYQARRRQLREVEPNPAHIALSRLKKEFKGGRVTLITQNVDDLHERGGVEEVIHMHGELSKLRCEECGLTEVRMSEDDLESEGFLLCSGCKKSILRPHIVWFEEIPMELELIHEEVNNCDLFVVIGTSGQVYPAAGLLAKAKRAGAHCIGFNLEPPLNVHLFDEFHQGPAGQLLPKWVGKMVNE